MKRRKKYRRFILFLLLVLVYALWLSCPIFAEERELPREYYDLLESLPDGIDEYLPKDVYSSDADAVGAAVAKMSGADYILSFLSSLVGTGIADAARLLCTLLSVLIISSIASSFRQSLRSEALSGAVGYCTACALFAVIITFMGAHLIRVGEYFERLEGLMLGIIPILSVIYAMGGNVTTALASNSALYIFLSFCQNFCAATVVPVTGVCTAFSLCGSLSPALNLRSLSAAIKRSYTFILGMIMTVLLFSLGSQTLLSSAADSISARAAKLVAANLIPIVGGSVGETLRTLASSVSYIKNVSGVGAIIFILILVLPILVTLLLTRFVFILAVAVADLLGCESESRMLSEIGYVYGMLVAVVSMSAVLFILALTVFLRCTVAV